MSNFSLKGDTLCRLIPSAGIDLFIPPDSLMGGTISRDTVSKLIDQSIFQSTGQLK